MKKKVWNRSKVTIIDIGPCRYCGEDMINTDSFIRKCNNKLALLAK